MGGSGSGGWVRLSDRERGARQASNGRLSAAGAGRAAPRYSCQISAIISGVEGATARAATGDRVIGPVVQLVDDEARQQHASRPDRPRARGARAAAPWPASARHATAGRARRNAASRSENLAAMAAHRARPFVGRFLRDLVAGQPVRQAPGSPRSASASRPSPAAASSVGKQPLDASGCASNSRCSSAGDAGCGHAGMPRQSVPRKGWTYCSAMSQGKKIQVSWLTSVM